MNTPKHYEQQSTGRAARVGVVYAVTAYLIWGLVPIYFKAVATVPSLELVAHRCVWSLVLTGVLLLFRGGWKVALASVRDRRVAVTLCASSVLVAINWLTFIWAVAHDQVKEASLGYFINPLVNVLLGYLFLKERLRPRQIASVVIAAVGVGLLTAHRGDLPWVALVLACSFGLYGLLRKTAPVGAVVGLALETSLLTPLALGYLLYLQAQGRGSFGVESWELDVLIALSGVATAVPLLFFAAAARLLRLATMGFLQYLAPSLQFLLAVVLYREPLAEADVMCFVCIWTALAIYSIDVAQASRRGAQ